MFPHRQHGFQKISVDHPIGGGRSPLRAATPSLERYCGVVALMPGLRGNRVRKAHAQCRAGSFNALSVRPVTGLRGQRGSLSALLTSRALGGRPAFDDPGGADDQTGCSQGHGQGNHEGEYDRLRVDAAQRQASWHSQTIPA